MDSATPLVKAQTAASSVPVVQFTYGGKNGGKQCANCAIYLRRQSCDNSLNNVVPDCFTGFNFLVAKLLNGFLK
jgi:hypothetical protein